MPTNVPLTVLPASRRVPPGSTALRPRLVAADTRRRLIDSHGRTIRDLRLSITDRCNFRCVYCMEPDVRFAEQADLLTVDEIHRLVRTCVRLGISSVRLTGGEPTVRPDLARIIRVVAELGVDDISMTTNGSLVTPESLSLWKNSGLRRLTFSLDSARPEVFAAMTRSKTGVSSVIDAIRSAIASGLAPIKVNAVVVRGKNEGEVPALARLARELGFEMRFIEFMPLDSGRRWDPSLLVPAAEIIARASEAAELIPLGRDDGSSTSESYSFRDYPGGRIGVIAPVTRPFCGACSRLRITADGKVRPCLFSIEEHDLMPSLRSAASDLDLEDALLEAVWSKQAGHGITSEGFRQPPRPMSAIGG